MPDIIFEDFTIEVLNAIDDRINIVLEESAGELEAQATRKTPVGRVAGGGTKNSWDHYVDEGQHIAYIGSNKETAIWVELGTGEYALEGKGRKGGWFVPIGTSNGISEAVVKAYGFRVYNGKDGMKFVHIKGMKPKRPLFKAYSENKSKIIGHIQNSLKGL